MTGEWTYSDQVCHVRRPRPPAHSKNTIQTTLVTELVRASTARTSIATNQDQTARLLQRKRISVVLQQNDTRSSNFTDNFVMISLNVNVFVNSVIIGEEGVKVN